MNGARVLTFFGLHSRMKKDDLNQFFLLVIENISKVIPIEKSRSKSKMTKQLHANLRTVMEVAKS